MGKWAEKAFFALFCGGVLVMLALAAMIVCYVLGVVE